MKLSVRTNLTLTMTALFVGALLVLGAVAFWRASETVSEMADRLIRQSAASIDGKVQGLLNRAEANARLMAGLVAPSAGPAPTLATSNSFQSIGSKMLEMIDANPEIGSMTYTLDSTGESVSVLPRPSGGLVVQTTTVQEGGRMKTVYVPFADRIEPTGQPVPSRDDLRQADWFSKCKRESRQIWTSAYLIKNSGTPTPGVTCAQPVFNRRHQFVGVVTVDFTIADLSRFIDTIGVGRSGYAALIEYSTTQPPRVVAHPYHNMLVVSDGGSERLATLQELGDPALTRLAPILRDDPTWLEPGLTHRTTVRTDDRRFQVGYQRISGDRRPDWVLAVIIPDDELMAGVWQTGEFLGLLGFAAVLGVLGVSYFLAQRVAQPLQELAVETGRVRSLDLDPRQRVESNVREIDELSTAMEQMKTGLRSLEKLVPADYARWLIGTGQEAKLGGERRHITTYFADIIGFTALSERTEPEELVEILAEYLDVLSSEVLRLGGTVDKFNGDDVMAFWGAPNPTDDHAFLACQAAIASQETLRHLQAEWHEHGRPVLRASFGISTGDVIVGNVGSRQRMNYTVIGDAVNLASRLQGLNKFYGTEILLAQQTVNETRGRVVTRIIDWVSVAGRGVPTPVYELMGLADAADPAVKALASEHNHAMQLYRAKEWAPAKELFERILRQRPHDGPARILIERCDRLAESPPGEDWDGSMQMQGK